MIYRVLRPYWPSLLVANFLTIVIGLASAVIAALIGPLMQILLHPTDQPIAVNQLFEPHTAKFITNNFGIATISLEQLWEQIPMLLVILAFIKLISGTGQWLLWERAGEKVSRDLRQQIMHAYFHLVPVFRTTGEGRQLESDLSTTITTDIKLLREYVVRFYGGMPRELFQIVLLASNMMLMSPRLFWLFILGVTPSALVVSRLGKKLRRRAAAALKDYSTLTEWLQQRLMGTETIKHYGTEHVEIASMHQHNEALVNRLLRAARTKALSSPLLEFFALVAMALVLGVALSEIQSGEISSAVQLSFFSCLALVAQSANKVGRYLNTNREGVAAVHRVEHIYNELRAHQQPLLANTNNIKWSQAANTVGLENVTATYDGRGSVVLSNFSYQFAGGKIYCISGPSGSGKSTLFKVLLGLLQPMTGKVEFNLRSRHPEQTIIGYMPQQVGLLPATIAENIAYPEANIDLARVASALAKTGMTAPVAALPDRENTLVGDEGRGLSGGQAQRVLLARLLYHDYPVILVDEGTSALDPEVEQQVFGTLRQLANSGAVVIMIAHRPSAEKFSDEIIRLAPQT